jgi:glycosyltransferase involved in cell wall biosynthesis
MDKDSRRLNVGVLTAPLTLAGVVPLSNLIDVLDPNVDDIYLITGKDGYDHFKNDKRVRISEFRESQSNSRPRNFARRAYAYARMQIQAARLLTRIGKKVDLWIFFIGADCLPLAGLAAKTLGRTLLVALSGSACDISEATTSFPRAIALLHKSNCVLSDHIILYSDLTDEWNLGAYRKKIIIAHRHFLDFSEFAFKSNLEQRGSVVGYVGRFDAEKGILEFIEAIPKTLAKQRDLDFLIVGEGNLADEVHAFLDRHSLHQHVKLNGWVPH